jgi:pimeloyl-ACP methyl ester carboxylesterase
VDTLSGRRPLIEPFETTPSQGVVLRGEEDGAGENLVLLHGLTATRRYVLQGSRMLVRKGMRTVAYDARGHGASSPAPSYEYGDLVSDLEAVLDERAPGEVVLVGSSMGAATALALTLRSPERVRALVQITPAYDGAPHSDLEEWDALADALDRGDMDAFVETAAPDSLPDSLRETARLAIRQRIERHEHPGAVAEALRRVPRSSAFDGLERLAEVRAPVLIVGSRDDTDPSHPLAVAEAYARALPDARLLVEGHGESPLAWRGSQLSRAILEFLAQV